MGVYMYACIYASHGCMFVYICVCVCDIEYVLHRVLGRGIVNSEIGKKDPDRFNYDDFDNSCVAKLLLLCVVRDAQRIIIVCGATPCCTRGVFVLAWYLLKCCTVHRVNLQLF